MYFSLLTPSFPPPCLSHSRSRPAAAQGARRAPPRRLQTRCSPPSLCTEGWGAAPRLTACPRYLVVSEAVQLPGADIPPPPHRNAAGGEGKGGVGKGRAGPPGAGTGGGSWRLPLRWWVSHSPSSPPVAVVQGALRRWALKLVCWWALKVVFWLTGSFWAARCRCGGCRMRRGCRMCHMV